MCTHAVKAPTKTSKCHSEEENSLTKKLWDILTQ